MQYAMVCHLARDELGAGEGPDTAPQFLRAKAARTLVGRPRPLVPCLAMGLWGGIWFHARMTVT